MRKWLIGIVVVITIGGGAYLAWGSRGTSAQAGEPETTLPPVVADQSVLADGVVVPARSAVQSLPVGGTVEVVAVAEGDRVVAGQRMLAIGAARQRAIVAQAQAGLLGAQARRDALVAGPRKEEIASAEATYLAGKARLDRLDAGATPEEIAIAKATVDIAKGGEKAAEGALSSAEASLSALIAGATSEEIAVAERQVEAAKNSLWGAQASRDSTCGRGPGADCDGREATVLSREVSVVIAQINLQEVRKGARPEELAIAQGQVMQAQGQLLSARAQVAQAEAALDQTVSGPTQEDIAAARADADRAQALYAMALVGSRPETIAGAEADVAAAEAALALAQAALDETVLTAPFNGTVGELVVQVGEQVAPGATIARVGDLSTWLIETSDLTELDVVGLSVGDGATVSLDAIPDLALRGKIARIKPIGENSHGDIVYTVTIALDEQDARLRWGMTAAVKIASEG